MMKIGKDQKDMVKQLGIKNSKKVIDLVGKMWEMYCKDCKVRSPYVPPCDDCLVKTAPIMQQMKEIQEAKGYVKK